LPARVPRLVAGITDQVGAADGTQQRMPHLLLGEDEDVVVGAAGMTAVRRAWHASAELISRTLHRLPEPLVVAKADTDQVHDRILHRDLDVLAEPGRVTLHQRSEDPDHAVHARA